MGKLGPMLILGVAEMPEPTGWQGIGWVLVAAGALALVLNQLHDLWQRMKEKPSAAEVRDQAAETFVTADHCQTMHAESERRIAVLERSRAEDLRAAGESRKTMYSKMDELRRDINVQIEAVRVELSTKIDMKTDAIPERVIAILKNTGAIGK